jgi:hypothetical protein
MQCYFIRDNKIEFMELLTADSDDDAMRQANELFRQRNGIDFHGLEVWEGLRLVYRHPKTGHRHSRRAGDSAIGW